MTIFESFTPDLLDQLQDALVWEWAECERDYYASCGCHGADQDCCAGTFPTKLDWAVKFHAFEFHVEIPAYNVEDLALAGFPHLYAYVEATFQSVANFRTVGI